MYPHTVVVVSHDIEFLHESCTEILWVKERKIEALPRSMVSQADLARMQRRRCMNFKFAAAEHAADHGISFHGVTFQYEESARKATPLLRIPGGVRVTGSSRCVLLGKNGSGKSTFLQLCAGLLEPNRGSVDRTAQCEVGYYSQLNGDLDRDSSESAAGFIVRECRDVLSSRLGLTDSGLQGASDERRLLEHARGALAQFGIEGDLAVNVPVSRLSGGQKACVKFAVLALRPAHILLLDEPTNHLDAEAREALARGLADFQGGVVVVTHDDALIYQLVECDWSNSELLVCQGGSVRCEREFGAHRLKSLKEQVRRAEVSETPASESSVQGKRVRPAKVAAPKAAVRIKASELSTQRGPVRSDASEMRRESSASGAVSSGLDNLGVFPSKRSEQRHEPLATTRVANSDEVKADAQMESRRQIKVPSKKLREIEGLTRRDPSSLDAHAREKLSKKIQLVEELEVLEGRRSPCVQQPCSIIGRHEFRNVRSSEESEAKSRMKSTYCVSSESSVTMVDGSFSPSLHVGIGDTSTNDNGVVDVESGHVPNSWLDLVDESDVDEHISDVCDVCTSDVSKSKARIDRLWSHSAQVDASIPNGAVANFDTAKDIDIPDSWMDLVEDSHDLVEDRVCQSIVSGPIETATATLSDERALAGDGGMEATRAKASRHSQQRKALVNLNKAVLKWRRRLANGSMSQDEFRAKVLASPVAMHLRSVHGDQFRADEFIQRIQHHAETNCKVATKQAVGGA